MKTISIVAALLMAFATNNSLAQADLRLARQQARAKQWVAEKGRAEEQARQEADQKKFLTELVPTLTANTWLSINLDTLQFNKDGTLLLITKTNKYTSTYVTSDNGLKTVNLYDMKGAVDYKVSLISGTLKLEQVGVVYFVFTKGETPEERGSRKLAEAETSKAAELAETADFDKKAEIEKLIRAGERKPFVGQWILVGGYGKSYEFFDQSVFKGISKERPGGPELHEDGTFLWNLPSNTTLNFKGSKGLLVTNGQTVKGSWSVGSSTIAFSDVTAADGSTVDFGEPSFWIGFATSYPYPFPQSSGFRLSDLKIEMSTLKGNDPRYVFVTSESLKLAEIEAARQKLKPQNYLGRWFLQRYQVKAETEWHDGKRDVGLLTLSELHKFTWETSLSKTLGVQRFFESTWKIEENKGTVSLIFGNGELAEIRNLRSDGKKTGSWYLELYWPSTDVTLQLRK